MAVAGGEGDSTNDMTKLLFACMQKRCVRACVRAPAPVPCHVRPGQCVRGGRAPRAPPPGRKRDWLCSSAHRPLMLRAAGDRRDDVERMLSQDKYLSVLNMHQQDGWTGRRMCLQPRLRTRVGA